MWSSLAAQTAIFFLLYSRPNIKEKNGGLGCETTCGDHFEDYQNSMVYYCEDLGMFASLK